MSKLEALTSDPDVMIGWDSGDPYGSAMSLWFDAAEYLYFELGVEPPASWEFSPSPIQTEVEEDNHFIGMEYDASQIIAIGDACERVADECKARDLAY